MDITRSNQNPEEEKKDDKKGGLAERRQTISALTAYHKKVGGQNGEEVNLEKQFRIKFANMGIYLHSTGSQSLCINFRPGEPEGPNDEKIVS